MSLKKTLCFIDVENFLENRGAGKLERFLKRSKFEKERTKTFDLHFF